MAMLYLLCRFSHEYRCYPVSVFAGLKLTTRTFFCYIQLLEFDDHAKHLNIFHQQKAQVQYNG